MADEYFPLTQSIVRNLLDKLYEKRKSAAIDIEKMVRQFQTDGKTEEIHMIIRHCGENFCVSSNCHFRKGGTIGLAAVAIALGKGAESYSAEIICPSIKLLQDSDPRVRYYACESLYNCIKVLETNVMPHFQAIFDALAKGFEDPDKDVRSAIAQLDRSMREAIMEADNIDVASIVVYLRDKIYPKLTQTRLFIINWIMSLDRKSGVNMVRYLPEILDGLLFMLDDPDEALINKLKHLLDRFLKKSLESNFDNGYRRLINILIFQITNPNCSDIVSYTALVWIEKFIETFHEQILPFTSGILKAILPFFDEEGKDETIQRQARTVSSLLIELIRRLDNVSDTIEETPTKPLKSDITQNNVSIPEMNRSQNDREPVMDSGKQLNDINQKLRKIYTSGLGLSETLSTLCDFSGTYNEKTKLAALEWLHTLMDVATHQTLVHSEMVFPSLFKFAVDPSSDVIRAGLQLIAKFSQTDPVNYPYPPKNSEFLNVPDEIKSVLCFSTNPYFLRFIYDLLMHLDTDLKMLEEKGDLIFGDLCYHLTAEFVFNAVAEIIQKSGDLREKFRLVHKLNRILLSNPNLIHFRMRIKSINSEESCHIFSRLYRAWSYNRVALLSLCLLSQSYDHCRRLIKTFGDHEMDVDTLNEIDLLIQFLEAPVFAFLRMHLMDPRHCSALSETLYGLLMLLPQSDAFRILQNRLNCIPRVEISGLIPYNQVADPDQRLIKKHIDFNKLLENLIDVQQKVHSEMLARQHRLQTIHSVGNKGTIFEKNLSV